MDEEGRRELPEGPRTDEQLYAYAYGELHDLAEHLMRSETPGHTLQPTALVHEAYLKLVGNKGPEEWEGRAHFFGVASRAMRQVLIEHARKRSAQKRGKNVRCVTLDEGLLGVSSPDLEILELNELLEQLSDLDPRMSRVVELRVFGGLTAQETAEFLEVSVSTVDRDWSLARMWFARELDDEGR